MISAASTIPAVPHLVAMLDRLCLGAVDMFVFDVALWPGIIVALHRWAKARRLLVSHWSADGYLYYAATCNGVTIRVRL